MTKAIIFDCEFLTTVGAPQRFWCGPLDPDPVVAQIGAVKIDLEDGFLISDQFTVLVRPRGRYGEYLEADPLFTALTGISTGDLTEEGMTLSDALAAFDDFSEGADLWSWGKDEINLVAISCFIAGIAMPIDAGRFGNVASLCLKAGMPIDDIYQTRSDQLATYFGVQTSGLQSHNALDDAMSVAISLQKLLREGRLDVAEMKLSMRRYPAHLEIWS